MKIHVLNPFGALEADAFDQEKTLVKAKQKYRLFIP